MIGHDVLEASIREGRDGCLAEDAILGFLAGQLAGDALRSAEAHLDSCADCRQLLAVAGAHLHSALAASSRPGVSSSVADLVAVQALIGSLRSVGPDDYRVERELSRGGMGRILLAIDRQGRRVAIKVLLNPSASAISRFLREMQVTATLQHPSIVVLHEAGRWQSGEFFFAMKLVEGRSLREELAELSSLKDRMALVPRLIAVTDALAYAHDRGVIHRDVKPGNILVGAFGETVVIDWGLAKMRDSFATDDVDESAMRAIAPAGTTEIGTALGTPAYMAPEQARGETVDERADVYGLGALLYHLLCGEPPYTGASGREVVGRVLAGPPRRLAERVPELPADLVAIVAKAMMPNAIDRYPTAKEMAEDLRRFTTGQLVSAYTYSSHTLVRRWLRRNRPAVIVAAALIGVGLLAAGASVARILKERNRAEAQTVVATAHQNAAEHLVEFLIVQFRDRVRQADRLDLLEGVGDEVAKYYQAVDTAGVPVEAISLRSRASALGTLGSVEYEKRSMAKARTLLGQAIDLWSRVSSEQSTASDFVRHGAVWLDLAKLEEAEGNVDPALGGYRRAIELGDLAVRRDPEYLEGHLLAANGLRQMSVTLDVLKADHEAALQASIAARDRIAPLYAKRPDDAVLQGKLASLQQSVGRGQFYLKRLDEAASSLHDSIALHAEAVKKDPNNSAMARLSAYAFFFLSQVEMSGGNLREALSAAHTFLERLERSALANPDNLAMQHDLAIGYGPLCEIQRRAGRLGEAENACRKRMTIVRKHVQQDAGNRQNQDMLLNAMVGLGRVEAAQQRLGQAEKTLKEAVQVARGLVASDSATERWQENLAFSLTWLMHTELQLGQSAKAAAHGDEALKIARAIERQSHPDADAQADLARLEIFLGDAARAEHHPDEATSFYQSARQTLERLTQQSPADVVLQVALAEAGVKLARMLDSVPTERVPARRLREQAFASLGQLEGEGRLFPEEQPLQAAVTLELHGPGPTSL